MSRHLGLTLAFALAATQAVAHAHLKTASPAEGATVAAPPEITLSFTEELEAKLSSITVKDARGGVVSAAPAEAVPGDRKALKILLKPVSPGTYSVEWAATSVDTHRVTGQYRFTVRP
ncbi:copper homeostasis periplasmic binding protein CopC [Bosea sp. UC22_33]|uniref:copper homeostasis periplasmic binding protein CopC n=1 Tax=Bosea sp. UC22_33 TaxID=3350165 RepID=UPI00366DF667